MSYEFDKFISVRVGFFKMSGKRENIKKFVKIEKFVRNRKMNKNLWKIKKFVKNRLVRKKSDYFIKKWKIKKKENLGKSHLKFWIPITWKYNFNSTKV